MSLYDFPLIHFIENTADPKIESGETPLCSGRFECMSCLTQLELFGETDRQLLHMTNSEKLKLCKTTPRGCQKTITHVEKLGVNIIGCECTEASRGHTPPLPRQFVYGL